VSTVRADDPGPDDAAISRHADPWAAVHLLAEPTRRRVFEAVRAARAPLTRDESAAAAGISRRLAAFHLDALADAGLLTVDYARPPGRSGPGAGRPAKRYRAVAGDVTVSLPQRHYDLAARVLAAGIRDSSSGPGDARTCALAAAVDEGRHIGEMRSPGRRLSRAKTIACAAAALDSLGYEPSTDDGRVRLHNCPFHAVVDVAPQLVCGMNESFITGLLEGLDGHPDVTAVLEPAPPDCCVVVTAAGP
jgi:predicted ArsR family transcriptional regulator